LKRKGKAAALLTMLGAIAVFGLVASRSQSAAGDPAQGGPTATILVYHRFGPVVADSMTVTTKVFAAQLAYLHDHDYTVVPLKDVVAFAAGERKLPPRAVAITADDGHRSVFTEMKPLIESYRVPVALFIYPSAISDASYAMTWEQLAALKATGWFTIESHTYWHPNFHVEKRRLSPDAYRSLIDSQLVKSKQVLELRLGVSVSMLAWPFGIYDDELIAAAQKAGYVAAFSIERRQVRLGDNLMALPRFIVTDRDVGKRFESLLGHGEQNPRR
jgi:peptidoglycan/xylan/chitin deacetylase (PgdA/CDA1 family)